jgi:hypothetical protein
MGDEHRGEADGATDIDERLEQLVARDGVEGTERFIEQHERLTGGQRARDRDALSLATGQLMRKARRELRGRQTAAGHRLVGSLARIGVPRQDGDQRHIPVHRPVRQQTTGLWHVADTTAQRDRLECGHVGPIDEDAPRGRLDGPVEGAQERRLARSALPHDGEQCAGGHRNRYVAKGGHGAVPVRQRHDPKLEGHGRQYRAREDRREPWAPHPTMSTP